MPLPAPRCAPWARYSPSLIPQVFHVAGPRVSRAPAVVTLSAPAQCLAQGQKEQTPALKAQLRFTTNCVSRQQQRLSQPRLPSAPPLSPLAGEGVTVIHLMVCVLPLQRSLIFLRKDVFDRLVLTFVDWSQNTF